MYGQARQMQFTGWRCPWAFRQIGLLPIAFGPLRLVEKQDTALVGQSTNEPKKPSPS